MKRQGFLKIPLAAMAVSCFACSGSAQPVTMTVDASKTGNDYTKNLPFSHYLKQQLAQFSAYGFKKPKDFGVG